jgi:hypothetical protein
LVCELELKYGVNYIEAFAFKQLARYMDYETSDVYEEHSPRILGVTQIPNLAYATAITTTSQAALQATIAHHGTVLNNLDLVPPLINLSFQQLIVVIVNIPPTINALAYADLMREFFRILELEFLVKSSEIFLQLTTFFQQKDETSRCSIRGFSN